MSSDQTLSTSIIALRKPVANNTLPLNLSDFDGSLCRAILILEDDD